MTPQVDPASNCFVITIADEDGEIGRFETNEFSIFAKQWEAFSERAKSHAGYQEWDGLIKTARMTFSSEDTYCPRVARKRERIAA